jgi:type I restriction enzyme, S subunit
VKAGWVTKRLDEVGTLQRGFDLPAPQRTPGRFPLVTSSGPTDSHCEAKVKGPGVATGRSGSIGNVFYLEDDFWPLNTALYVKNFHGNHPRFIFYLLQHLGLARFASGAGVPTLNRNDVHGELVNIPEALVEQKRIVAVLDEAFEGLTRARANAEANLQNARELFQAYLRTVFAENSHGWPTSTLPNVCVEFGRGKSRHRPRNDATLYGGDFPFVQTGDLTDADHYVTEFSQTYSQLGLAQSKLWPAGTVCVAIVGATIGESGILDFDACFPDSVIGMTADPEKADPEYIEYLLQFFKAELKEAGKGSARDNINLATFEHRMFPMPDVLTQRSVSEKLRELSIEAKLLYKLYEKKAALLENLRQSLLQKAFAGELA